MKPSPNFDVLDELLMPGITTGGRSLSEAMSDEPREKMRSNVVAMLRENE